MYNSNGCSDAVPQLIGAVNSAQHDLISSGDDLEASLSSLSARLTAVLSDAGKDGGCVANPTYNAPLAADIQAQASRLRRLNACVRDLLDRLEI